jgi:hypothetical protein
MVYESYKTGLSPEGAYLLPSPPLPPYWNWEKLFGIAFRKAAKEALGLGIEEGTLDLEKSLYRNHTIPLPKDELRKVQSSLRFVGTKGLHSGPQRDSFLERSNEIVSELLE